MQNNQTCNNIEHPRHYNTGDIECIDAMLAAFGAEEVISFSKLNAFKYIWRAEHKSKPLEDLMKAQWYLAGCINLMQNSIKSSYTPDLSTSTSTSTAQDIFYSANID